MRKKLIQDAYTQLLERYVKTRDEALLMKAADLGRELMVEKAPAEEISGIHNAAARRLAQVLQGEELRKAAGLMSEPLTEMLMVYVEYLHKQTEGAKALARQREQLDELVKERTAALEAAREDLLRMDHLAALGQLVAVVSHDLRNPLGTIRNSLFTLKKHFQGHDTDVDKALVRTERSIQRCENLIEELLSCVRIQAPNRTNTDIDNWLDELLDEIPIPEGIRLTRKLSSGVELPIDRERLGRCVLNVIENACQAMSSRDIHGSSELTVETSVFGGRVQFRVTDTGPGIPPVQIEKVFKPLFTTKASGVGLGLTIVRQIMRQHSGDVEIESPEGRGTSVTLWLPRGQQEVLLEETAYSSCG